MGNVGHFARDCGGGSQNSRGFDRGAYRGRRSNRGYNGNTGGYSNLGRGGYQYNRDANQDRFPVPEDFWLLPGMAVNEMPD